MLDRTRWRVVSVGRILHETLISSVPLKTGSTATSTSLDAAADSALDINFVTAQLNRAVAIVGSSMAVFTFLLFFLYPRFVAKEIDPILFQGTLAVIIVVVFALAFAGFFYFEIYFSPDSAEKRLLLHRGNVLYSLGLELVTLEPAMILFTIGLYVDAILASILFLVFLFFIAQQFRRLGQSVKSAPHVNL